MVKSCLRAVVGAIVAGGLLTPASCAAADPPTTKKIVLIAGKKSHGPGDHEYEKGVRLLKACLDTSPNVAGIRTETYFNGWPADDRVLDDAATIFLFSDGSDHDEKLHPILQAGRLEKLDGLMKRGVGLVAVHYTVFVPRATAGERFLDWIGGYFDYESGPADNRWFSRIQTAATRPEPATPGHAIARGLGPFDLKEEYYYHVRFRPGDERLTPILTTALPNEPLAQTVAWAVERKDGGRGFGFTGGHFHANWRVENFRKMVLNALLWTAHVDVPEGGVQSTPPDEAELVDDAERPIHALILTGHNHPAHDWRETTKALQENLARDGRIQVDVVADPQQLPLHGLKRYQVLVMNYANWQRPGLGDAARTAIEQYLAGGGGMAIVHFANGAWNFSLPEAAGSDWPEWRGKICRRVWDHTAGQSGHDAYGKFRVDLARRDHEITAGLAAYETTDELYFRQQGSEPIDVLATAHSKITDRDEPMAFVYEYGRGRVFQTVLGHAAESLRTPGTADIVRRGVVWAAGRPQRPPQQADAPAVDRARFGQSLEADTAYAEVAARPIYNAPPLSVECWARLTSRQGFNILVASHPKESSQHWELYTYAGSGQLSFFLPGYEPAEIRAQVDVVDGQWHHVAATFDGNKVQLFVDGRAAHAADVKCVREGGSAGPLWIGAYPPHAIGCAGQIDDVRLSNVVREFKAAPTEPLAVDEHTIGLWRFDVNESKRFRDFSRQDNPAVVRGAGQSSADAGEYDVADSSLSAVLIDHSPDDSFLSIRSDTAGRLFVGCREALFVYEPKADGTYGPRQLLYRFPPDSWINDIEIRGDDVYTMTVAALYVFPGARLARENVQPRRILWGSPVDLHVTYHGLAWGPEGDLYFTSGDPLLAYGDFNRPDHWGHWTVFGGPKDTPTPYTGQGGFFRVRPDGSKFRYVAGGTRGSFGIAFDKHWNLFSNDNDHESIADRYSPCRLLHVAPGVHFFWPRGWAAQLTPERADLVEIVNAEMGRDAPVGQAYYDDTLLPAAYRNSLLVARWGQRRVDAYAIEPHGATFQAKERPLLVGTGGARPVGVAVGRGGRVFVALSYMAANAFSPHYASDLVMIGPKDESPQHPFDAYEAPSAPEERLWAELSHDDWSRRQAAHQEILRRGGKLLDEAARRLGQADLGDRDAEHLLWLAAASSADLHPNLFAAAVYGRSLVRLQGVRALAARDPWPGRISQLLVHALEHGDAALQRAALAALLERNDAVVDIAKLAPFAASGDTYLRQTAAFVLARRASLDELAAIAGGSDAPNRLGAVLAIGFRLTVPPPTDPLPADVPLGLRTTGSEWDARKVLRYADKEVDLTKLGPIGSFTMAERWNKAQRTSESERLFELLSARLADADEGVRLQAAYFLDLLDDARTQPLVKQVREAATSGKLAAAPLIPVEQVWLVGPFADRGGAYNTIHPPEQGPIDLAAEYLADGSPLTWREASAVRFDLASLADARPDTSTYLYFRLYSARAERALAVVESPEPIKLWHNGRPVAGQQQLALDLQPGSNDLLVRVHRATTAPPIIGLGFRATGQVAAALPEKLGLATLAERLAAAAGDPAATAVPAEFLDVDWSTAVQDGDPTRGRQLFSVDALGCVKCHAIAVGQTGGGGPSLADAAKRFTVAQLVESILLPSKQVAPIFRASTVVTGDGQVLSGLVVRDGEEVELLLADATHRTLQAADIDQRRLDETSPMPVGLVKKPDELRDLLAYLLGENPEAP